MITSVSANGKDIARIVENISTIVEGEIEDNIIIACVSMALLIQMPNITPELLIQGVSSTGDHMSSFLSAFNEPTVLN